MRVNAWGNKTILYHKTNKEASNELCSVIKHLGSGWSTQEVGRNTRLRPVFPPTLLSCSSRFLRALQQNRAPSRLLYLLNIRFYYNSLLVDTIVMRIMMMMMNCRRNAFTIAKQVFVIFDLICFHSNHINCSKQHKFEL